MPDDVDHFMLFRTVHHCARPRVSRRIQ